MLSPSAYNDLKRAKEENNRIIYQNPQLNSQYNEIIAPMFSELYYKLLDDVVKLDENSMIYRHHIKFVLQSNMFYGSQNYLDEEPNMIVADYIASMTDDYFIALHKKFFPSSKYKIEYKPYFSEDEK